MMFVRQEKNVQNVPRLGECFQEPLPRLGIPAVEQVTSPGRFFTCHLLAVKAALEPEDGGRVED